LDSSNHIFIQHSSIAYQREIM